MNTGRDLRAVGLAALFAAAAWAQSAGDVSVSLATKGGRSTFYVGQAVEVEFQFRASLPGRYQVLTIRPVRQVRQPDYDKFLVEPSTGVADPLADIFAQFSLSNRPPRPVPLGDGGVTVGLQVNEWLSIRQPGHYRISAETTRVQTTTQPANPVTLRTNTIEIDVVLPPVGWAEEQSRQAVAVLGDANAGPDAVAGAARVLRFLETPEAARALARFFENGPEGAQGELRAGLFASPLRDQVIAAMEERLVAPDVAITYSYLAALMELVDLTRYGPMPTYAGKTPEERQRWLREVQIPYTERSKSTAPEHFGKLADAVRRKQGSAAALSLATLVTNGPKPISPSVAEALVQNFSALPEISQARMLQDGWAQIGSPLMEPLVRTLAEGSGPLRDAALVRLWELNPAAARTITLDRIRKVDVMGSLDEHRNERVLLSLPDKTLPEMDQLLIEALKQGKLVEPLVARYASADARAQLESWADDLPGRICDGLLPYFFRVDPVWAAAALARFHEMRPGTCGVELPMREDFMVSPGLERQAVEDLENRDVNIRRAALTLLQYAGSMTAQQPLFEAFERSQREPSSIRNGIEQGFLDALLHGIGWVATPELIARVSAACATDTCRTWSARAVQDFSPPIGVSLEPGSRSGYAMFGGIFIHSREQFEKKIAQFPKGTAFSLGASGSPGTWFHDRVIREATEFLVGQGMTVVDRPRPAVPQ